MSEIKRYLKLTDDWVRRTNSTFTETQYGFVLKHGKLMKRTVCDGSDYYRYRGVIKECYRNASTAALENKGLTYVEGYAASIIPVPHAWCITRAGYVVELTWEKPGSEYYGVPFKTEFLRRSLLSNKYYGLIDNWHKNWPLLRGVYPKREWLKT